MVTWACHAAATDWSARPICSMAATKPTVVMPMPPHSSGMSMPRRPSWPISRSRSVGHRASSHACGARVAISFWAKSRHSAARSRSASVSEKSMFYTYRSVQFRAQPEACPDAREERMAPSGPPETAGHDASRPSQTDVDVLVVGAGVTGIYQLHRAREAGFSALLVEAGEGVGGTWYWNRYPGARFDSESYTYGYLFDRDLFDEWEWSEHFAAQPETERYLNHVVDRFDLRRDMRFGAAVTSATWDEPSGTWVVVLGDGSAVRARYLIAATGVLSVPYTPDVPGRDDFRGVQHHTGLWPAEPVDMAGKRVAVVGTSSSGVQVVSDGRRRGRRAHRVPAQRQLVHPAEQHADHAGGAAGAPGRLRAAEARPRHVDLAASPTPSTSGWPSTTTPRPARRSTSRCGTARAS